MRPRTQKPVFDPITAPLPLEVLRRPGTVLLESQLRDRRNRSSYLFTDPVGVVSCVDYESLPESLRQVEEAVSRGLFAAGFISYEAGLALVPRQEPRMADGFPLLRFGLYQSAAASRTPPLLGHPGSMKPVHDLRMDIDEAPYADRVRSILRLIASGETYQVNFTDRIRFRLPTDSLDLYLSLRLSHPVPYGAYLHWEDLDIVSSSPELFLKRTGSIVETRPMKGTAPRGSDRAEDRRRREGLRHDPKNRAENLMIADLMRNDLGRICEDGTVRVVEPFRVEAYPSLFQMTTGVRGRLRPGAAFPDIMGATFPPGSVTGAPKVRTMQIISEVETQPRKAYTGCLGAVFPGGDFVFSVAIRTVICLPDGRAELGVGSGIVADSDPGEEYREALLKSRFLTGTSAEGARLLETILLDGNDRLVFLREHLERMRRSAAALGYPFDRKKVRADIDRHLSGASGPALVRLLHDLRGESAVQVLPLPPIPPGPLRVSISRVATDPGDLRLAHKTTDRALYDDELAIAREGGFAEVLFQNRNGHLTEGSFTNLFLLIDGSWFTPPLSCGLLPGIWRQAFLRETGAAEKVLTLQDLSSAERVVVGNSVRGPMEVGEVMAPGAGCVFRAASDPRRTISQC